MYLTDKDIRRIIQLFADGDDETGIWGYDTSIYPSWSKAIQAVRNIINEEKSELR